MSAETTSVVVAPSSGLSTYRKKLAVRKKSWAQYLKKIDDDPSRVERNAVVKELIRREGIPPEHRGKVWIALTGVREKSVGMVKYADLVETFAGQESTHTKQVDKDLLRTFQEHNQPIEYQEETIGALRRVLVAYSWLNPEIGYCQSMNFITALFLLFMDEEDAFWLLKTTVEDLLPHGYYTYDMLGVRVDERVLSDLLAQKLPKISTHLDRIEAPFSSIVTPWLLCLFINVLPFEATLRFFDSFFLEGSKMIFRLSLALFKVLSKSILATKDFTEVFSLIKGLGEHLSGENVDVLMDAAFNKDWMGSMPGGKIAHMRQTYYMTFQREAVVADHDWLQKRKQKEQQEQPPPADESAEPDVAQPDVASPPTSPHQNDADADGIASSETCISPNSGPRRPALVHRRPAPKSTLQREDSAKIFEVVVQRKMSTPIPVAYSASAAAIAAGGARGRTVIRGRAPTRGRGRNSPLLGGSGPAPPPRPPRADVRAGAGSPSPRTASMYDAVRPSSPLPVAETRTASPAPVSTTVTTTASNNTTVTTTVTISPPLPITTISPAPASPPSSSPPDSTPSPALTASTSPPVSVPMPKPDEAASSNLLAAPLVGDEALLAEVDSRFRARFRPLSVFVNNRRQSASMYGMPPSRNRADACDANM